MIPTSAPRRRARAGSRPPSRARAAGGAPPRARRRSRRAAGRVLAPGVPDPRDDPRLVVRDPVLDAVAEPLGDDLGVLDERLGGRARRPAARVLERLRRVPVEERRERLDAVREQLVDEPVVEVEARLVHAAAARPAGRAATRSRSGTRRARARASARCRRGSGGRSRTRSRRCRRSAPCRASRRSGPRRSRRGRPRAAAPSIWYEAVAAPQRKSAGNGVSTGRHRVSSRVVWDGAVTWQRAAWPGRASTSSRRDVASRRRSASGQRVEEAAARGRVDRGGRAPGLSSMRSATRSLRDRARRESSSCVYGCSGLGEHLLDRALLDDLAGVHDEDVVGDVARAGEVVRDVEERDPALLLQLEHQVQDPDADRDVEHAGRLVGERRPSARRRARARSRRAGAGRRRARAGTSPRSRSGGTRPTLASSSCTRSSTCAARHELVDAQRPLDVVADRLDRVQRAERVLEDHLHLASGSAGRRRGRAAATTSLAVEEDACPRSARRAARAGGRRCSCRCRSRRRAR